ncbi:hypothetical protein [Loktanella sp. R86503]|uniref:hypothetical protein n=1 Tax=Loktanella sp. R86503 TaxID=3093847 RepID=UPI0036DB4D7A
MTTAPTKPDDGGPAYPQHDLSQYGMGPSYRGEFHTVEGMSLRDYFAGQAIQGFCADPSSHQVFGDATDAAENAYMVADAMIAARKVSA